MTQDTKTLKAEIISALDFLPPDSLKLLAEFVAFLRAKVKPSTPLTEPDPILQLGTQPIVENVTDASIHHDKYLYHP